MTDPSAYGYRKIGGIPTVVTSDHHYVIMHWEASGIRDADLLHIDGHHDMNDGPRIKYSRFGNCDTLNITNFICYAVHYGIISNVYWLNPHSATLPFQYFGSSDLSTSVDSEIIIWNRSKSDLAGRYPFSEPIDEVAASPRTLIVDIDLDAFCCGRRVNNTPDDHDGIPGWEDRMEKALSVLANTRSPSLITVTRSEGFKHVDYDGFDMNLRYVPSDMVDLVQDRLMLGLEDIYVRKLAML